MKALVKSSLCIFQAVAGLCRTPLRVIASHFYPGHEFISTRQACRFACCLESTDLAVPGHRRLYLCGNNLRLIERLESPLLFPEGPVRCKA